MTDDLTLLASTYLDGAATPDERAQVDGDPELLAEVERLRQVRAVLGASDDETEVPISVRERHLAAALHAWDRLPDAERSGEATPAHGDDTIDAAGAAGTASITSPGMLRDRRKRRNVRNTRLLTVAAAAIILAGAGFIVRGIVTSDSGTDDASADTSATESVEAPLDQFEENARDAADETFSSEDAADSPAAAPAEAPDQLDTDDVAPSDAESVVIGPESAPPEDGLELLTNNAELARFANDLVIAKATAEAQDRTNAEGEGSVGDIDTATDDSAGAEADGAETTVESTLEPAISLCDVVDELVGPALWQTPGLFDEPVIVGINTATNEAVAFREEDCTVVARAPLG